MKKKNTAWLVRYYCLLKILKIMRFTIIALLLSLTQTFALESYSQQLKLSMDLKDVTVEKALDEVEKNSDFFFLYSKKSINVERVVDLKVLDKSISDILDILFADTNVSFIIKDRQIMLVNDTERELSLRTSAQSILSVSGKVTDSKGLPVPGVTVFEKGTTNGTITDSDGNYTINKVGSNQVLVFSFVGMGTQEVLINGRTSINVVLEDEFVDIEDVIVIGYGTAKRQDYPGSVNSEKMEDSPVALAPNLNVLESLKGNVAGLNIGATNNAGGEPFMLIRGQNSISGSNNPLIVLDGVIYLGELGDINPNDIASFDILKDAVSAAAYGSRSANGVIAITTKKGKKGKPIISFNTSVGVQSWQNEPKLMKGEEWLKVVNDRTLLPEGTTSWMKAGELQNYNAGNETDWIDFATRTGVIQDYQVSISGGGEGVNYYLSSSYNDNKGIVEGDDFNRISILGKIDTKITSWLRAGVDASFSRRDYSGLPANIGIAEELPPFAVKYRDEERNLEKFPYEAGGVNPLWGVYDGTVDDMDVRKNYRLNTYAVVEAPWIKGLSYRINYIMNMDHNQSGRFYYEDFFVSEGAGVQRYEPSAVVKLLSKANGNINNNKAYSYVFDNILNYSQIFGDHSFEATLVATRDYRRYEMVRSTGSDFADNGNTSLGIWGLHKATNQKVEIGIDERANVGYLGRLSYSFNDKYFLTSSYRRDGASVFGAKKKWGNFAAAGIAWRISNEDFMDNISFIDDLKLKLSWGQNGSQGTYPYQTLSNVANGSTAGDRYEFSDAPGKIEYGIHQNSLGNSDLGWESTETWNTGFEAAILKNRLFIDFDTYYSQTTDQIFVRQIPVMTGFNSIMTSLGQVDNSGIELSLKTININNKDLSWNTTITYWSNNNKLVKLYGEDKDNDGVEDDDIGNSLFIGKSLGAIYGFEQDGIVQEDDTEYIALTGAAPGAPKYKDIDGEAGITSEDRKILGYSKERFRLNMSNSASYKGFELYMMVAGVFGGNDYYVKSNTAAFATNIGGRFNDNMTPRPYWTPENKSNVYPSAYFSGDNRYLALQSRSFVRIQDVSLSYNINNSWTESLKIQSLKVFVSAKNLATFTKWEGGDPETGTTVRENKFPVPSTYSIGAKISF